MNSTLDLHAVEQMCREYLCRKHMRPLFVFAHGTLAVMLFIVGCELLLGSSTVTSHGAFASVGFLLVVLLCPTGYWIHTFVLARTAANQCALECPHCRNPIRGTHLAALGFSGRCPRCRTGVVDVSRNGELSWAAYNRKLMREARCGVLVLDRGYWLRWGLSVALFGALVVIVMLIQYFFRQ